MIVFKIWTGESAHITWTWWAFRISGFQQFTPIDTNHTRGNLSEHILNMTDHNTQKGFFQQQHFLIDRDSTEKTWCLSKMSLTFCFLCQCLGLIIPLLYLSVLPFLSTVKFHCFTVSSLQVLLKDTLGKRRKTSSEVNAEETFRGSVGEISEVHPEIYWASQNIWHVVFLSARCQPRALQRGERSEIMSVVHPNWKRCSGLVEEKSFSISKNKQTGTS